MQSEAGESGAVDHGADRCGTSDRGASSGAGNLGSSAGTGCEQVRISDTKPARRSGASGVAAAVADRSMVVRLQPGSDIGTGTGTADGVRTRADVVDGNGSDQSSYAERFPDRARGSVDGSDDANVGGVIGGGSGEDGTGGARWDQDSDASGGGYVPAGSAVKGKAGGGTQAGDRRPAGGRWREPAAAGGATTSAARADGA